MNDEKSRAEELERLRHQNRWMRSMHEMFCLFGFPVGECEKQIAKNESRIAELEAEQADPWREAKRLVARWEQAGSDCAREFVRYVRHLESENNRLTARVAELEARPVPPLDPARVYMTARKIVQESHPLGCYDENAELYSLAESEDGKSQ